MLAGTAGRRGRGVVVPGRRLIAMPRLVRATYSGTRRAKWPGQAGAWRL